jgi:hypothetical protein
MKTFYILLLGVLLGGGIAGYANWSRDRREAQARLAELERWQSEKTRLETLLKSARNQPPPEKIEVPVKVTEPPRKRTPQEILAELRTLPISRAGGVARSRRALGLFEELVEAGPSALPAIHGFLARLEEMDYELDAGSQPKGPPPGKGKGADKGQGALLAMEFIVPPSLRFGLFDVVRRIGGEQAEQILAEVLGSTGRGAEVYYLARVLEQVSPGRHRDTAVAAARDLLINPVTWTRRWALDQHDRQHLYAVLTMYQDGTVAELARAELVRPDGSLDMDALRVLKDTLRADALPALAEAASDPRITEPKAREDLLKEALSFAGADPRADQLLAATVTQEDLPLKLREKTIRDLDKHGFESPEDLTAQDLQIIQARLRLIEALGPALGEPQLVDAWQKTRTELTAYLADPQHKAKKKKM